jgi:hypothetical protein
MLLISFKIFFVEIMKIKWFWFFMADFSYKKFEFCFKTNVIYEIYSK